MAKPGQPGDAKPMDPYKWTAGLPKKITSKTPMLGKSIGVFVF